jgi:hypothetical protein
LYIKGANIMAVGGEAGCGDIVDVYVALQCGGHLFSVAAGGKVGCVVGIV